MRCGRRSTREHWDDHRPSETKKVSVCAEVNALLDEINHDPRTTTQVPSTTTDHKQTERDRMMKRKGLLRNDQDQLHSNTNYPSCDCSVGHAQPSYLIGTPHNYKSF